jgi:hypothetical protein
MRALLHAHGSPSRARPGRSVSLRHRAHLSRWWGSRRQTQANGRSRGPVGRCPCSRCTRAARAAPRLPPIPRGRAASLSPRSRADPCPGAAQPESCGARPRGCIVTLLSELAPIDDERVLGQARDGVRVARRRHSNLHAYHPRGGAQRAQLLRVELAVHECACERRRRG